MRKEFYSQSVTETEQIAKKFAEGINTSKPCFIAMYGDLGVGKTAFVRGVAEAIAPEARVKSPTYTIVNEYVGKGLPLYHLDVYRIEDEDDLSSVGFYDYVKNGVCIVEWSENIPEAIPEDSYRVTITKDGSTTDSRKIVIEAKDENISA